MSFEERFAEYPVNDACIENIEYHSDRNLDRVQLTRLSSCNYIEEYHKIGESTLADAICDRIVHDSYTIVIGGKYSIRKKKGIENMASHRDSVPNPGV